MTVEFLGRPTSGGQRLGRVPGRPDGTGFLPGDVVLLPAQPFEVGDDPLRPVVALPGTVLGVDGLGEGGAGRPELAGRLAGLRVVACIFLGDRADERGRPLVVAAPGARTIGGVGTIGGTGHRVVVTESLLQ